MKHLPTAIITLIIGLSVAYYTFILNEKHVDLRYTLSEKIPTKFVGSSATENVQQLVVKNIGNIPAENIQIKINGYIEEYDVLKNLSIDKVEINKSKNYFEAIYASLPPEAQFTFIFKTTGFDISNKNLEIKHNSGRAYEALDNDTRSNLTNTLDVSTSILFLIYLLLVLYQFRVFALDHYKSRGEYENHYDFLNKKRPFYFPQGKWDSIRRDYIKSKRTPNHLRLSDITEGENYKILDNDKPNLASNNEWSLLLTSASKSFTDQLTYLTNTASTYSKTHKLFLLRKPKNLPESNWEEIVNNINETFLTIKKLDSKLLFSKDHFSKELKLEAPQGIIQSYWDKYSDFIKNKYYEFLYTEIISSYHPSNFINETDLSFLTEKQKESIENLSYKVNYNNIKKQHHYTSHKIS